MTRYGHQYGPDYTFLGVPAADLDDPSTYQDADVVVVGAPFDGGASYRSGARFGPQAILAACYLGHDGSRPSLAMRVDGLQDLTVVDVGDVEMYSGDAQRSCADLEKVIEQISATGAAPLVLGGDHTITWPDVTGVARARGWGKVSSSTSTHADTGDIEFDRWSVRPADAPAHRAGAARGDKFFQIGLRGYWPLPDILEWMTEQKMRSYEMTEIVARGFDVVMDEVIDASMDEWTVCSSASISTSSTPVRLPEPEPPSPVA